jgi:nitroreductase
MKSILEALNWRYATDKFLDTAIPEDILHTIIEAARLAPSSMNFQPWKYISIQSPEIRNQIFEAGFKQESIKTAPTLLVLTIPNTLDANYVNRIISKAAEVRKVEISELEGYHNMLQGFIDRNSPEKLLSWSAKQAYISLGILLLTAAQLEVDAAPMEGFNAPKVTEILGLKDYTAVTLIGLGYRSPEDDHQTWPKVRFDVEEMLEVR